MLQEAFKETFYKTQCVKEISFEEQPLSDWQNDKNREKVYHAINNCCST